MVSPSSRTLPRALILMSLTLCANSLVGGLALSVLGSALLFTGSLALFAVLYSVGVIVSLTGTGFLLGFMKQFKQMFAPVRIAFTLAMIAAFAMVWVSAFAIDSAVSARINTSAFQVVLTTWLTRPFFPQVLAIVFVIIL